MKRSVQWSIAVSAVTLVCSLSFAYGDIPVAAWFHALNDASLFALFSRITLFGDSLFYLTGGLLLFIVFRGKKSFPAYAGLFLFCSVAASGLITDLIKYIAGRARPELYFSEQLFGFDFLQWEHAWTSFPSGHSATAFSVAMLISTLYPRWRTLSFAAGFMVAFSRIFLTEHYVSDVIAGSFLGIISTTVVYNSLFKKKLDPSEPNSI